MRYSPNLPDLPFYPRRLLAAAVLLMLTAVLIVLGFPASVHVTHTAHGAPKLVSWVWLDTISGTPDNGAGRFGGQLRLPDSRVLWLDNTSGAEVVLTINDAEAYHGTDSARVVVDATLPQIVAFRLDYGWTGAFPPRGHIGLAQEGVFGLRSRVSPWQFAPDETLALHGVRLLAVGVSLMAAVSIFAALRLSRQGWLILAGVLALSLVVHLVTLAEKFNNDPGIWTMATVWDNYVLMGRGWLAGSVPIGGQIYQQGNFIYLGILQQILGPDLSGLYVFNTVIGSFAAVFVLLAGWALFDRPTGLVAGLLTALFAPLVHYQHTLQVVAPSSLFVAVLVAAVAGVYRWRNPVFAGVSGVLVGLAGVFQGTVLVLGALPLLALVLPGLGKPRRTGFNALREFIAAPWLYAALIVIGAGLTVLPITITNLNAGYHVLTANLADYQLFRSNNRNSTGLNTFLTQSEQLTLARGDTDWVGALQKDLARRPWHIAELTMRRIALFWDAIEHSDSGMTDYVLTGLDVSPTLRLLSLGGLANFRVLMSLGVIGLVLGLANAARRRATLLVAAGVLIYIAALALFYVIGRVRMPLAPLVIVLAAAGLVEGYRRLRTREWRWLAIAVALAAALALLANVLVNNLPHPEIIHQIPTEATPVEAVYNGEIKLLGYAFYETNAKPNGYLTFELYWQALRPPSTDYTVTVRFVNPVTQRIDYTYNFLLGGMSAPQWVSTRWSLGDIFQERYLIPLPDKTASAYNLLVGLYSTADNRLAALTDATAETLDKHIRLTAVSIHDAPANAAVPTSPPLLVWGDQLALETVDCQADEAGVTLTLNWFGQQRVTHDQHLFVHVLKDGEKAAQRDALPEDGVPLDAWLPQTTHTTIWHFDNVTAPVAIRLGFYEAFTQQRWTITASREWTVQDNYVEFACLGEVK